ncbi:hypothetical protein PseudUWO311_03540 [Pseudanabaena sp. UWO311]|uniref:hypothetical protein n=1 Tax=Pseudanabaena sp. UWO311 TaxID=2487337 RepID=UPI0011579E9C|nr:hypothetical protein [Pseudanabaena sp. UWO311]TYQ28574.1 hypothetical protein PseudUWO311_03540 [Pseudanabaena sp. UWO311]
MNCNEETDNLGGEKHYHHRLCISTRLSNGNAIAQAPRSQPQFIYESEEGLAFAYRDFFVRSFKMVAQMLNP